MSSLETAGVVSKVNGVDVAKLLETIDLCRGAPDLASFQFRLKNHWVDGGLNRSRVGQCYGAGAEQPPRAQPFVLEADEPPVLLGSDKAPNPVEYLLHALSACLTTSIVYHAAAEGIRIDEIESRIEGDLDLRGCLGLGDGVPRGFQNIRVRFKIKADVPQERLEDVCRLGPTYSPVFDTITRAVKVDVGLDR